MYYYCVVYWSSNCWMFCYVAVLDPKTGRTEKKRPKYLVVRLVDRSLDLPGTTLKPHFSLLAALNVPRQQQTITFLFTDSVKTRGERESAKFDEIEKQRKLRILCRHAPSHPYNAGKEYVGFSPTRQTLIAPSAKSRAVLGEFH